MPFSSALTEGRTIRKVMEGIGLFQHARIFFMSTISAGLYFPGKVPCTFFFFRGRGRIGGGNVLLPQS